MSGFTIISYPAQKNNSLLSLADDRSRYMLPFGGRYRVVDFTIRNSVASGAEGTIIFDNYEDNLIQYVEDYSTESGNADLHRISVYQFNTSDMKSVLNIISKTETSYFVLYNGDNPSIINMADVFNKFKLSRKRSLLIKLRINGRATMAYKVVICDKKTLISHIKKAIRDKSRSLNLFETVINSLIHKGIGTTTLDAFYWTINSVTEYYFLNREIIWNTEISAALSKDRFIKSNIKMNRFALLDEKGSIKKSFISDHCYINGKVENSIIFPGVDIEEGSVITDSIILPFVKIGPGARITNSIIDESTITDNDRYNAGINCRIGNEEKYMKNNDFPEVLNSSITLIGKNNYVKENGIIGAACYITSGKAEQYFTERARLNDGDSVL
jgi:ADP-glucose pyrophosphorylase